MNGILVIPVSNFSYNVLCIFTMYQLPIFLRIGIGNYFSKFVLFFLTEKIFCSSVDDFDIYHTFL